MSNSHEEVEVLLRQAQQRIAQLEAILKAQENIHFQSIIDASPVPYAIRDENNFVIYINPAFTRVFGYELKDVPMMEAWARHAYPDEQYRSWVKEEWNRRLQNANKTRQPFEPLEINIACKNRSQRTVLADVSPLSDDDSGKQLIVLYDITDRKKIEASLLEQENELVEIIDHIPSMIFLKEAKELRYARFNTAGEEMTGIKREDMIGQNDHAFFPKEQADFFISRDRKVLSSGKMEDIPIEPIDTPWGTRQLHTRKVAIKDKDGKPKYLLGISDDITEFLAAEAERERLQKELQQAHKMESLGQLTGGIAHDFNNLLGIITGFTDLATLHPSVNQNEQLTEYLVQIKGASDRATKLISQMLAFSRKDATENKPMALGPYIKDDIEMLRATLPSSIEISEDIEQDVPMVMMNPVQLNQILLNLTVNARDAMDGQGRIHYSLSWRKNLNTESPISHTPIKGDWIALSISDTGCGIDEDNLTDIFTPFYTNKPIGKGTGMGLAVVYGIMKSCDGGILVESEIGKGSTFTLLFKPVADDNAKDDEDKEKKAARINGNGEKILIVDDEENLANFIGEIATYKGYTPSIFTDSTEALQAFKEDPHAFDLLFTDQTMPRLTGIELIEQMREIRPDLPIILCTGYSDKVTAKEADTMGFKFMQKPVETNQIIVAIEEQLRKDS